MAHIPWFDYSIVTTAGEHTQNLDVAQHIVARGSGPWQRDSPQGRILSPSARSPAAVKDRDRGSAACLEREQNWKGAKPRVGRVVGYLAGGGSCFVLASVAVEFCGKTETVCGQGSRKKGMVTCACGERCG